MLMMQRLSLSLLFFLVAVPALWAQTPSAGSQGEEARTQIILERQLVRFVSAAEAREWRLEVFNQKGEPVYDSGFVSGTALEWPLQNPQGEAAESGLYAYTLTIKDPAGGEARVQRGHVILDRASASDRVWVTSDNGAGIGADSAGVKLKVVGGGETSLGGAELPALAARPEPEGEQGKEAKRATKAKATGEKPTTPAAATAGTPNQISKFASDGTTLINSTIIETVSGDIGIGTAAPGGVLDLQRNSASDLLQRFWNTGTGGAKLRYVAATGATSQVQLTDNAEWLMSIAGNNSIGMQFRVRGVGTPNIEGQLDASARMTILRSGNVGIGTTSPASLLHLLGSATVTSTIESTGNAFKANLQFKSKASGGTAQAWSLGPNQAVDTSDFEIRDETASLTPFFIQKSTGRVGIGTTNPADILNVVGSGTAFKATDGAVNTRLFSASGPGNGYVGTSSAHPLVLRTSDADRVTIDASGRVGIGISQPLVPLHVLDSFASMIIQSSQAGQPAQVRFWGTRTGPVQQQWNVGSTGSDADFEITDATAGSFSAVYIKRSTGNVAIGPIDPQQLDSSFRLTVNGNVGPYSDGQVNLGSASRRWAAVFAANGTIQTSDARLKQGIKNLGYGLREVMLLRPVSFEWKDKSDGRVNLGLIAQEVETIIPEVVVRGADEATPLGMNYASLLPVVIKAVQEQETTISALQGENTELRQQNATLQARNAALDARLTALERKVRRFKAHSPRPQSARR